MESGTLLEWLVREGDQVKPGDVVAVVETHKGAIEVECFQAGVIEELVAAGSVLPVGALLARIGAEAAPGEGAASVRPATPKPEAASPPARAETDVAVPTSAGPAAAVHRVRISPAARRRAAELGIPVGDLPIRGIDTAVTFADVEREAARRAASENAPTVTSPSARPAPSTAYKGFDPGSMREAIGAAMSRSKREIPHYYLTNTVDLAASIAWLERRNRDHEPAGRLLPAVLLLKACARALHAVPELNGFFEERRYRRATGVHVGWAIALRGGGLVAPAIRDADRKSLPELMQALHDCVQRARTGRLRSSELTDATVTVTSLGERGAESVLGVIYPPQVAILGIGRIVRRPWVVDDAIVARPLVSVSLAADHRVSDGHLGGRLLAEIDAQLQAPENL